MSITETGRPQAGYALGHTPEEYERLRMQARVWEAATGRLLDQVGLGPGASCLDAGCGPGETMRAMAERVGPAGRVRGIDADASLGALALAMLHGEGHRHCSFSAQDLTAGEPIPGAPFDLVCARLLLFPHRRSAWTCWPGCGTPSPRAVIFSCRTTTSAASVRCPSWTGSARCWRVWTGAFSAVGADVSAGTRLPQLFAQAGCRDPGRHRRRGPQVARHRPRHHGGHLPQRAADGPGAGVTTERASAPQVLASIARDAAQLPRPPGAVAVAGQRLEAQGAGVTTVSWPWRSPAGGRGAAGLNPGPVDVGAIRRHFTFAQLGRIVTNNAASTQPPRELLALYESLAPRYENVHRGQSTASQQMTAQFEQSYDTIAQFLGAPGRASIALYRNTTEAINAVMYSLLTEFRDGDNVVTTMMEHNSNYVPWYAMCKEVLPRLRRRAEYRLARFDPGTGELDLENLASLIDHRSKLVCCTGASNFLGTRTPLRHRPRAR